VTAASWLHHCDLNDLSRGVDMDVECQSNGRRIEAESYPSHSWYNLSQTVQTCRLCYLYVYFRVS